MITERDKLYIIQQHKRFHASTPPLTGDEPQRQGHRPADDGLAVPKEVPELTEGHLGADVLAHGDQCNACRRAERLHGGDRGLVPMSSNRHSKGYR